MKSVGIIIPVHNRINHTIKCLDSLKDINYKNFKIIVVDDGSTDGTSAIIKNNYPNVVIFNGDGNLWWSGAMNIGVEYCRKQNYDFILCLNNDNVVSKDFLDGLIYVNSKYINSIVGSFVYFIDKPNLIRFAGGKINWWTGHVSDTFYKEEDNDNIPETFETDWLGGMGVLVPINAFSKTGYFDEKWFPHYSGDQDFWLRARNEGFKLLVTRRSKIWVDNKSSGIRLKQGKNNLTILFNRKFHANIITRSRFFFRHFPKYRFIFVIIIYYLINIKDFIIYKTKKNEN
jgi:GT2 family glycosyltransferase